MKIQIFSEYANMVEAGRAKALTCPMHEEDIYNLYHELFEDKIILKCYACQHVITVGQNFYDIILDKVTKDFWREEE